MVLSEQGVVIDSGDGDDKIYTGGGPDEIKVGAGEDTAHTGGGDDRIVIETTQGAKRIDGGNGIDVLSVATTLASVSIEVKGSVIVISDGAGGKIWAQNVNVIAFSDAALIAADSRDAATVGHLFGAFLDRAPETRANTFWLDQLALGRSLAETVSGLGKPADHGAVYSVAGDTALLAALYQRDSDIPPDPSGITNWLALQSRQPAQHDDALAGPPDAVPVELQITGVLLVPGLT